MNIALVGPRKSGKSTAAEALIQHGYTRLSLADPVKDAAVVMLNAFTRSFHVDTMTDCFDRGDIEYSKATFRPLLEWIGSTFGRDYLQTPDRWINLFRERFEHLDNLCVPIVCDDVRFPNEAEALREMGFLVVFIDRPPILRAMCMAESGEDADEVMPSELHLSEIQPDYTLHNNRTVDDLQRRVLLLARKEASDASPH
jgi:hypothetical protein